MPIYLRHPKTLDHNITFMAKTYATLCEINKCVLDEDLIAPILAKWKELEATSSKQQD